MPKVLHLNASPLWIIDVSSVELVRTIAEYLAERPVYHQDPTSYRLGRRISAFLGDKSIVEVAAEANVNSLWLTMVIAGLYFFQGSLEEIEACNRVSGVLNVSLPLEVPPLIRPFN